MKSRAVIEHFGTLQAVADVLGISKGAVSQWGKEEGDGLVPEASAYRLQDITNGLFKVDPVVYTLAREARNALRARLRAAKKAGANAEQTA